MSFIGLDALLRQRKQEVKAALHDAATTFEIDPADEQEDHYQYSLILDSRRQADKIADHALASVKDANRSVVTKVSNGWAVTLTYGN